MLIKFINLHVGPIFFFLSFLTWPTLLQRTPPPCNRVRNSANAPLVLRASAKQCSDEILESEMYRAGTGTSGDDCTVGC